MMLLFVVRAVVPGPAEDVVCCSNSRTGLMMMLLFVVRAVVPGPAEGHAVF